MRTVTYRLDDLKDVVIHIGRAGENLATRVRIDAGKVFAEYPAAVLTMKVINPAGTVYGREVSRDGDLVIWDVTDGDLAAEGQGEMQLTFTEGSVIVKSADARTEVCRSIVGGTTPPDPVQDWIDRAEEVLEEVEDAFPEGGTTGQVLAKKSNADFDTEWVDQGSGGTVNYNELENKPQIGGVTLTGNKSLHDLGAAAESDIPDVSGFYTKPAGGIPASDIAAGVIPDPEDLIDDESTAANKVLSAQKVSGELADVKSTIDKLTPDATASDIGKALIVKTVADGKPSSYEYGEAGGGSVDPSVIAQAVADWCDENITEDPTVVIDESLLVDGAAADAKVTGERIKELAESGSYVGGSENHYIPLTSGMMYENKSTGQASDTGYVLLTSAEEAEQIEFDTTKYKFNFAYFNGNTCTRWTSWITSSPIIVDPSVNHNEVYINVRKLSGNMGSDDLNTALHYGVRTNVGNLATKQYVDQKISKGTKCIYPDGFTSRIKPDIYFNGAYYADINIDNYKLIGTGEVWVATDGNDSTGTGEENNPYATITKALSVSAKTIHLKEGTYTQEVHYSKWVEIKNVNLIGHGNVVLQNDSVGHTVLFKENNYVENITFKHGNSTTGAAVNATCSGSGQLVCFVGCTFRDGGSNGLSLTGIDAIVVNCSAYGNRLDGLNYHRETISSVDYIPNVLEIDCTAYNNGSDQSGNTSCNGSTSHEGTRIIRLNGEYYSCYGGIIADTGEGTEPTISVNYGVCAHDGTGEGVKNASFWASTDTKMYLYDCFSYGSTYDITAENDGYVVSRRLTTGRDVPSVSKASGATVLQY